MEEEAADVTRAPSMGASSDLDASWRWKRHRKKWHRKASACFRYGPFRVLVVVLGWLLACGVGALLWRDALKFLENEFLLKCENRKEVRKKNVCLSRKFFII